MEGDLKIYVCGAKGVGKSTIVSRLVQGSFVEGLEAGNATQTHRKEWESSGQRFWVEFSDVDEVDATYLRDAHVTVVVFSVADRASFEAAKELQSRAGAGYNRVLLLGNKTDVSSREVTREEAQALAEEAGSEFLECSTKAGKKDWDAFVEHVARQLRYIRFPPTKMRSRSSMARCRVM